MTDLISRADAIEAVREVIQTRFTLADWYENLLKCGVVIEDTIKALPSADADRPQVEIKPFDAKEVFDEMLEHLPNEKPKEPHTQFLTLDDAVIVATRLFDIKGDDVEWVRCEFEQKTYLSNEQYCIGYESAKREIIDFINGADEEYGLTCETCAYRNMCIMSAPDGNWRACKDYKQADFVAVVRCKDCRHYSKGHCYEYGGQLTDEDYCSRGVFADMREDK